MNAMVLVSLAAVAGLMATPAAAELNTNNTKLTNRLATPEAQASRAGGATLDRTLSWASGIELSAGAEGGAATAKASGVYSRTNGIHSFGVTATSPFDDDEGKGGFALDAFTAGSSLKIEYSWSNLSGEILGTTPAKMKMCEEIAAEKGVPLDECDSQFVSTNARDRLDEFDLLALKPNAFAWSLTAFGKVGHKEFKYVDAAAFAENNETETPWAVGVAYSHQPIFSRQLYTLKFQHQRDYKSQDEGTVCPAGVAPVVCLTGPLGSPEHDDKDLVSAEFRQRFGGSLGISIAATYDFGSEAFGLDVPIYFIGGGDYSGGIRFGYIHDPTSTDDDKDELSVGVFVSKALKLY